MNLPIDPVTMLFDVDGMTTSNKNKKYDTSTTQQCWHEATHTNKQFFAIFFSLPIV